MSDSEVEEMIQTKGKTAARVTPKDLNDAILSRHFINGGQAIQPVSEESLFPTTLEALGLLTICVIVMKNGFAVIGHSACASPENFDAEIGRKVAFEDAKRQMWPLLGYALKVRLCGLSPMNQPEPGQVIGQAAQLGEQQDETMPVTGREGHPEE